MNFPSRIMKQKLDVNSKQGNMNSASVLCCLLPVYSPRDTLKDKSSAGMEMLYGCYLLTTYPVLRKICCTLS